MKIEIENKQLWKSNIKTGVKLWIYTSLAIPAALILLFIHIMKGTGATIFFACFFALSFWIVKKVAKASFRLAKKMENRGA